MRNRGSCVRKRHLDLFGRRVYSLLKPKRTKLIRYNSTTKIFLFQVKRDLLLLNGESFHRALCEVGNP